jgi:hypothetical protein
MFPLEGLPESRDIVLYLAGVNEHAALRIVGNKRWRVSHLLWTIQFFRRWSLLLSNSKLRSRSLGAMMDLMLVTVQTWRLRTLFQPPARTTERADRDRMQMVGSDFDATNPSGVSPAISERQEFCPRTGAQPSAKHNHRGCGPHPCLRGRQKDCSTSLILRTPMCTRPRQTLNKCEWKRGESVERVFWFSLK